MAVDKSIELNQKIVGKARGGEERKVYVDKNIKTRGDAARAASALHQELQQISSSARARETAVHEFLHAKTALEPDKPRAMGYRVVGDERGVVLRDAFVELDPDESANSKRRAALAPASYPDDTGELSESDLKVAQENAPKRHWWWPPSWFR